MCVFTYIYIYIYIYHLWESNHLDKQIITVIYKRILIFTETNVRNRFRSLGRTLVKPCTKYTNSRTRTHTQTHTHTHKLIKQNEHLSNIFHEYGIRCVFYWANIFFKCLSVCLSLCLPVCVWYQCACVCVCSVRPSVRLSVCPPGNQLQTRQHTRVFTSGCVTDIGHVTGMLPTSSDQDVFV